MGLYVEPIEGSKKDWFIKNAQPVKAPKPEWIDWKADVLPVAFMDNGPFQAIAVLWDIREFKRVTYGRPDAVLGVVSKLVLRENVPGGHKLKELK